jgi:hypothetical protein
LLNAASKLFYPPALAVAFACQAAGDRIPGGSGIKLWMGFKADLVVEMVIFSET